MKRIHERKGSLGNFDLFDFSKLMIDPKLNTKEDLLAQLVHHHSIHSAPADRLNLALKQVETLLKDRVEELGVHAQVAETIDR